MAHNNQQGRDPYRDPWAGPGPDQHLAHKVSGLSDAGDFNGRYDRDDASHPLRGRDSMVSIDSDYDRRNSVPPSPYAYAPQSYSPASSWSGSFSYSSSGGGGYAAIHGQGVPPTRSLSKGARKPSYSSVQQTVPESIVEEETYDLSLLKAAAPMATTRSTTRGGYAAIHEHDDEEAVPAFDFTATLGPLGTHDDAFIKKLQEEEARGNLTGGLGQGFRADSQVHSGDLLSSPTTVQRSISRSFSRRNPNKGLNRAETLRHMGQDEANRRGEVIEVIMEEHVGADLSNIEGPNIVSGGMRQSTYPVKEKTTQTFYPQPNWKPFSMRWPYLASLILLSVALAVMQEVLFQMYREKGLVKFTSPDQVSQGLQFVIKFGPTLLAVIYGVLWQFTDFEVRRLEAFYQLSKEGGAVAAESINIDYATSFNFFRPFRALRKGHYAVAVSSIATIFAVSLVPTFAAAAVVLSPSRAERMANPNGFKTLNFNSVWSRLLTSTLGVTAVLGCILFYLLQSRKSGLISDVRGIAGLASMAVVSHILMDFKDMDTASHRDIHNRLKYNRYMLRNSSLAPDDSNPVTSKEKQKSDDHDLPENPHPVLLRTWGIISMIAGIFLFIGFIPVFLFTRASIVTDKAPWVVTVLAVGLKMAWGGMETGVRMMEPYYILSKRHAPAKTLLLDYTALPFGYMPVRALLNGHFLVFLVGFGSVMTEFFTVMVGGLATVDGHDFLMVYSEKDKAWEINSGTETVKSFYVSVTVSLFILLYMVAVALVVLFRRRHPFLPRQPNTIASVLAYIHQSKMLYDFVGTEKFTSTQVQQRLGEYKTYGLGWFEGRDGQKHCGVDQEELISGYKHGISLKQGTSPWNMQWDVL
ncbi:spray [Trichoderma arundinaceum]|uniref:Spray n=1 Tax=Trichoderma arundinaceum TaxID=490622 RepID=A0A395NPG8_TRIAR|nr:spray [Trichoderma arundinaceum]